MPRSRHENRARKPAPKPPEASRARKVRSIALPILTVAALIVAAYLVFSNTPPPSPPTPTAGAHTAPAVTRKAASLDELLAMTPEQLAGVDIAEMNLLCAAGLPGGENIDIGRCLRKLDEWAAKVRAETERHLYRAHDPRWAEHYRHSENWLRAEFLAQVLQEDCGVHYNMERVRNIDFTNARDLFIHGMIDDDNGGTCSSMPVLYVAVGRRLGYPLKLVQTKAHVFVRWDDGHERFNIETTSNGGVDSYPDEYYRNWPEKWTPAEERNNRYLISLSPAEELAQFLASRGHCLLDTGRAKAAFDAYALARKLAPQDPAYPSWMRQAEARLRPPVYAGRPPHRGPDIYQNDSLADIDRITAINQASTHLCQGFGGQVQGMAPQPSGMQPAAQPGAPNPYQPYQPPVPRRPPR